MVFDAKGNLILTTEPGKEETKTITLSSRDLSLFRESFTLGLDWDDFSIDK
jgi:hypothetical protein